VLVLVLLGRSIWWLQSFATSAESLPIEELALVGERRFTSDNEVRQALQALDGWSLMSVDVAGVRDALTDLPWVDRASVRREWPNRLRVYLVEHKPVARWQKAAWLNERAESYQASDRPGLAHLPNLTGPEGSEKKVWLMWQQIRELLALSQHRGRSLSLSERHAWLLVLDSGVELQLGRQGILTRVQRFIDLWPELIRGDRTPVRVDLRYDTGLAVRWQQQENEKG
jgi:cell division protein FtsQ